MTAPSLRARLLAGYLVILAVMGAATAVLAGRAIDERVVATADARLRAQARAVTTWMDQAGHPERLAPRLAAVTATTVQLVGADGVVLGDSLDPGRVGQPGDAPELDAARRTGEGHARRALAPGGDVLYLLAVRDDDGRVVRLAVPVAELDAAQAELRGALLLAGAIGLVAALLLGVAAIRAVTRPLRAMTDAAARLATGDYRPPAPPLPAGPDELGVLGRTLTTLAAEVEARVADLTAARDLSRAVVEALVEGVVAVDAAGAIVLTNGAATTLLGAAPMPAPLAAHLDAARAGAERDDELVVAERLVRVAARPLPGGRGAVLALYDVTQLRALDRVRRDFLASAAHELRTPVTAIAGFAETLRGGEVAAPQRDEFLAAIHRNAGRIAQLVAGLLTLERLDARPARLTDRAAVPLAPLVEAAAAAALAARPDAGATITREVAADAIALGDAAGLEQIVQNLLDNAVAHGGRAIVARARRGGARVVLEVEDDGAGIAAEHVPKIFERFYRADRRRGGSGLGLAIVAEHARAMGGAVSVESGPGRTVLRVELDAAPLS